MHSGASELSLSQYSQSKLDLSVTSQDMPRNFGANFQRKPRLNQGGNIVHIFEKDYSTYKKR